MKPKARLATAADLDRRITKSERAKKRYSDSKAREMKEYMEGKVEQMKNYMDMKTAKMKSYFDVKTEQLVHDFKRMFKDRLEQYEDAILALRRHAGLVA